MTANGESGGGAVGEVAIRWGEEFPAGPEMIKSG
jgi:hypothetical protein